MTRLAEVWRTKTVQSPSSIFAARTAALTSAVISRSPGPAVSISNCLTIGARFERGDRGKRLALQEFQERAAAGRYVRDVFLHAEFCDGGERVAASGDGKRLRCRDRTRD